MNLEQLLNKAMHGDHEAYVALKTIFGHEQLKVVDLGNKNKRLCDGIRTVLKDRDFRVRVEDVIQDGLKQVLEENEFIPKPAQ